MAARSGPSSTSRRPSSGRRDVRSSPRATTPQVVPARTSGTRFTTRAAILLAVTLVLVASYTQSVHAWWQQRSEIVALEEQNRAAKSDIAELEDTKERWEDPAYVRQQARDRFGWVQPGEVGYRVIGADGKLKGQSSTLQTPPVATTRTWSQKLWSSVEEAGREPSADTTTEDPSDTVLKNQ